MRVRVIVADQSEARFYDLDGVDAQLRPAGRCVDPDAPSQQEQVARPERSVRGSERAALAGAPRRLAPAPRPSEPRPRRDAAMRFARQIAAELDAARRTDGFDRIVLMAGPTFIGLIRSALPEPVRATLFAEVRRDLLQKDLELVRELVPPEAFE